MAVAGNDCRRTTCNSGDRRKDFSCQRVTSRRRVKKRCQKALAEEMAHGWRDGAVKNIGALLV
jgi:hypothetical protein